jgi:hypothetical protein
MNAGDNALPIVQIQAKSIANGEYFKESEYAEEKILRNGSNPGRGPACLARFVGRAGYGIAEHVQRSEPIGS